MQPTVRVIKANKLSNNHILNNKLRVAAYCRVSTDGEEQLNSFTSQMKYYKGKIESNPEWTLVNVYADEAITGTKVELREGFKTMINDAMNGKIDIIMTKSISRFARNTVDTLNFVRRLKENNVAVFFEEENINTLTMDGELLLTILSSVAQQEVQNISEHVKAGLRMKLQRGEMIGFNGCYGYDYNSTTKEIIVNKEEAQIVKYIFERYSQGYGAASISKELYAMGIETIRGNERWSNSTITGIIRNEKYYGDAIFGKTYTMDAISKRRVDNKGEVDSYHFENHHEPIVSKELWDKANKILENRAIIHRERNLKFPVDFVGKHIMSHKLYCGCCGTKYTRRTHAQTTTLKKPIWKCITQIKKGISYCKKSKSIDEVMIQIGFVTALKKLINIDTNIINKFLTHTNESLSNELNIEKISTLNKSLTLLKKKKQKLVDLMLEESIDKETYTIKVEEVNKALEIKEKEMKSLEESIIKQKNLDIKLNDIKTKILEYDEIITFDEEVFRQLVNKVIIGSYTNSVFDPYIITYVFNVSNNELESEQEANTITICEEQVLYEFWSFENVNGEKRREKHDHFTIKIDLIRN